MQVVGDNYNVLSSCAGHCGNLTAIMVDKGQLIKDDLTIDNLGDGGNNVHEEQKPDQG